MEVLQNEQSSVNFAGLAEEWWKLNSEVHKRLS